MWTRWKSGKGKTDAVHDIEEGLTGRACGRGGRVETEKGTTTTSTISWRLVMKRVCERGGRLEKGRRTPSIISTRDLQKGYVDEVDEVEKETRTPSITSRTSFTERASGRDGSTKRRNGPRP